MFTACLPHVCHKQSGAAPPCTSQHMCAGCPTVLPHSKTCVLLPYVAVVDQEPHYCGLSGQALSHEISLWQSVV